MCNAFNKDYNIKKSLNYVFPWTFFMVSLKKTHRIRKQDGIVQQ